MTGILDKLPDRLSKEEFDYYFNLYKNNGDINARNKIIEHNLRLVNSLVFNTFNTEAIDRYDLISVATMQLIRAVEYYDANQNVSFSTFASVCILRAIKSYYMQQKRKNSFININSLNVNKEISNHKDSDYKIDSSIDGFINNNYLSYLLEILSEKDKDIFEMYFGFGKYNRKHVGREIAIKYNLSTQEVYRLINDRLKQLKISSEDARYRENKILKKQRKNSSNK